MSQQHRCGQCGAPLPAEDVPCVRCALALGIDAREERPLGPGFLDDLPVTGKELLIADRYRVIETIGRGGMGVVYKAWQANLDRVVAVKMVSSGAHAGPEEKARFLREAKTVARLQHPGIVAVHDWGEDNGVPFFSMDYIEGRDLAAEVKDRGAFPPERAAAMVKCVADAVAYAHGQGIVHRDLKPQNLLLAAGDGLKITDFGLAKAVDLDPTLTATGQALGTAGYMAPEQVTGKADHPVVDVYGLGAVLYHLLTGRAPFVGSALGEILEQVRRDEPVKLRRLSAGVPLDLETICLKCLEKEPARRYGSAAELSAELERFLRGEPILARPPGLWERTVKWCRRKPVVAGLSLALLLTALASVTTVSVQRVRSAAAARTLIGGLVTSQLQQAEEKFAAGRSHEAMSHLSTAVLLAPERPEASQRLQAALRYRNFPLPVARLGDGSRRVLAVRFSPDSKRALTLNSRGECIVWDTSSGRQLSEPWQFTNGLTAKCVKFSADGRLVGVASAVTNRDGHAIARTWWSETGRPASDWRLHRDGIITCAFTPDGRYFTTAANDGTAVVWGATNAEKHAQIEFGTNNTWAEFSPDGRLLAVADDRSAIRVFALPEGRQVGEPLKADHDVSFLFFDRGARFLGAGHSGQGCTIWRLADRKRLFTRSQVEAGQEGMIFADGSGAYVCGQTNAAFIDLTPETPTVHPRQGGLAPGFDPTPCAGPVLPVAFERLIRFCDTRKDRAVDEGVLSIGEIEDCQLSPDGRLLAVCNYLPYATVYRVRSEPWLDPVAAPRLPTGRGPLRLSGDGSLLALSTDQKTVQVFSTRTGSLIGSNLVSTTEVADLAISRQGTRLVMRERSGEVSLWELPGGQLIHRLQAPNAPPSAIAFNRDGSRFLILGATNVAIVQTAPTQAVSLISLSRESGPAALYHAEFSPTDDGVVVCGHQPAVCLFDRSGQLRLKVSNHDGPVLRARFSADGRRFVTASMDATVRVWETDSGLQVSRPLQHRKEVFDAHFSPDGRWVVTASLDGSASIWETVSGRLVGECANPGRQVLGLVMHPAGTHFATVFEQGAVQIWTLPDGQPITEIFRVGPNGAPRWDLSDGTVVYVDTTGTVRRRSFAPWPGVKAEALANLASQLAGRGEVTRPAAQAEPAGGLGQGPQDLDIGGRVFDFVTQHPPTNN